MLATDLDGTFLGGSWADRDRLYRWIDRRRDEMVLLFVTGRDLPFIRELCADGDVPFPDLVIGDVGTTVVAGPDLTPVPEVDGAIAARWGDRGDEVRAALADAPGLELQPTPFRHRVSYWYDPDRLTEVTLQRIRDMGLDVLTSADTYLDVLPAGVSKGPTLLHLIDHLGVDPDAVLVAGDTLNDLSLFTTGLRGVAVGGAEPALAAELDALPADLHALVHRAEGHGAAGILEAIDRWFPHLEAP